MKQRLKPLQLSCSITGKTGTGQLCFWQVVNVSAVWRICHHCCRDSCYHDWEAAASLSKCVLVITEPITRDNRSQKWLLPRKALVFSVILNRHVNIPSQPIKTHFWIDGYIFVLFWNLSEQSWNRAGALIKTCFSLSNQQNTYTHAQRHISRSEPTSNEILEFRWACWWKGTHTHTHAHICTYTHNLQFKQCFFSLSTTWSFLLSVTFVHSIHRVTCVLH